MIKSNTLTTLLTVLFVLSINTATAQNNCVVDVPDATSHLPGAVISNLSLSDETLSFDGNLVDNVFFSSGGSTVYRIDANSLNYNVGVDRFFATANITGVSPVIMDFDDEDQFSLFIGQENGLIQRSDPEAVSFAGSMIWTRDLKRVGCGLDSIEAAPIVQLRRFSSYDFKARFHTNIVYVGTKYSCVGGSTANRIYAINTDTGDLEWTFNWNIFGGVPTYDVDGIYGDMLLESSTDTLYFATLRTDPFQHSLWAINIINGTKRWSVNVGVVLGKPLVAGNRLYVSNLAGEVIAVDKTSGIILWKISNPNLTPSPVSPLPFISSSAITVTPDNRVLIGLTDYFGNLLLATDNGNVGNWLWSVDANYATGTPVFGLADKYIYVGTANIFPDNIGGLIKQYDISTGNLIASRNALINTTGVVTNIKIADTDKNGTKPILYATTNEGTVTNYCLPFRTSTPGVDTDSDSIEDGIDNCPNIANAGQEDLDQDGLGDACDPQNFSDTFTYSVGGNVTGLVANESLVLQNNGVDDLTITENGEFTFATRLLIHTGYNHNVTILTQPVDSDYICEVTSQGGTTEHEFLNQAIEATIECSTNSDLIWKDDFE